MRTTGVVLMTYGSPRDLDDVGAYITRVRGGRAPDDALLTEFRRRYERIGMSPLIDITRRQAAGLQDVLGDEFRVAAGMRFSEPSVEVAVGELVSRGAQRLLGLILSPQYSATLMGGYDRALEGAAQGVPTRTVHAWHLNPAFVDVLASRIRGALATFPDAVRPGVPVLLTAHSLPRRVVDREPDYLEQLQETARAVALAAELPAEQWTFCYQSAGHTPEEWLKPDLLDVLPQLAGMGQRQVVVAPVQFLADHLETLYDVDVAGHDQALGAGLQALIRVQAPNAAPDFLEALASVVRCELSAWSTATERQAWAHA
ncbi:MAG: ferrochelatase [Chloroflexi bacterium]|nr:ferrochelatase [Chloroflexota bacterium]